jgi:TM2 domain-containing membrane protein YozV
MKNKTTAGLLAIFLGGIGIHRFYLGQGGKGVLYLLFCWTLIPAFVAFVDAIIFFTMSDESFNNKFNHGLITTAGRVDVSDELGKLHDLKEKGVISHDEFEQRKAKLLR